MAAAARKKGMTKQTKKQNNPQLDQAESGTTSIRKVHVVLAGGTRLLVT